MMDAKAIGSDSEPVNKSLNYWGKWAQSIYAKVSPLFKAEGSEVNAFYLQNVPISKQLLKDLELFPI